MPTRTCTHTHVQASSLILHLFFLCYFFSLMHTRSCRLLIMSIYRANVSASTRDDQDAENNWDRTSKASGRSGVEPWRDVSPNIVVSLPSHLQKRSYSGVPQKHFKLWFGWVFHWENALGAAIFTIFGVGQKCQSCSQGKILPGQNDTVPRLCRELLPGYLGIFPLPL